MFLTELAEPQIVVIYPGRFQPFHKGHAMVFSRLIAKFGRNNVFVATSDKRNEKNDDAFDERYPFTFAEKAYFMQLAGVPDDRIVQASNPFQVKSVMASDRIPVSNPENTIIIFAVSEKDMIDDPTSGQKPYFSFKPKKDGSESYYQPIPKNIAETENMNLHGYIMTVPVFEFNVLGKPFTSSTKVRDLYRNSDTKTRQQIITDLFGKYTAEAEQIMTDKLTRQPTPEEVAEPKLPSKTKLNKVKLPKVIEGKNTDIKKQTLIYKARLAHPNASSDEEALALYINDKEERDFNNVEKEEHGLESKVAQLQAQFQALERSVEQIAKEKIARPKQIKEIGAVGQIAKKGQKKDPRYSTSMTCDVNEKTPYENLHAFDLAEDKELFLKLREQQSML
jgi:cytidyltransferase-like protein